MKINLERKSFAIFGLHESGKTVLAKQICSKFNSVIFDPIAEFDSNVFNTYVPKAKEYPEIAMEFERFLDAVKGKFNLIYVSEASRVFPNKRSLKPNARNFIDTYRHIPYSCAFGLDCRRPAQLHTDLIETAKFIFVYHMTGVRDLQYMNFINSSIQEIPKTLPEFHFMLINPDRSFVIHKPVNVMQ
jgi:hypothetical protein